MLQDHPTDRRFDRRTLALEVATHYAVNALGVHTSGSEQPEEPEQPEETEEETVKGTGNGKGKEKKKEECSGLGAFGPLDMGKAIREVEGGVVGRKAEKAPRRPNPIQPKALRSLPIFVMKNGGTYYIFTMLKYILRVEHHPYILFYLMREMKRSGESDSDAEEFTDVSKSDNKEEEVTKCREWEKLQRRFD
jgi:hypothetical protein